MAKARVWPWILGLLVCAVLAFAALAWLLNRTLVGAPAGVRAGTVLEIELAGPLEEPPGPRFGRVFLGPPTLREVDAALRRAAADDRVVAVRLEVGPLVGGFAKVQELRAAVAAFRDAGKPAVAYLEDATTADLMLAVAADEIVMAPTANLMLGLVARHAYYRELLDRLGIRFEVFHTGPYKTAMTAFTERTMPEGERRMTESLLDSVFGQWIRAIADDRELEENRVREVTDRGIVPAPMAREAGLVDDLGYRDSVQSRLDEIAGGEAHGIGVRDYLAATEDSLDWLWTGRKLALVYVAGTLVPGDSDGGPFSEGLAPGERIAGYIREARRDDDVAALVLRIDSPGGAVTPSDVIWREATMAAERMPVIVSMSDVAASGGYWIATAGQRIYADPATYTGSIGVVVTRLTLAEAYDKLDVEHELLRRGENADILHEVRPLRPEQADILRASMRSIYDEFLSRVAASRNMTVEQAGAVAEGRVWTGEQALERGLVDELGGLHAALEGAAEAAGLQREQVRLRVWPPAPGLWEQLGRFVVRAGGSGFGSARSGWGRGVAEPLRLLGLLRAAGPVWALADTPLPASAGTAP